MQIFIQHHGQQTGPFTLDQVRAGLANGIYQASDLAWYEGAPGWLPLSTVPGLGDHSPPAMPGMTGARTSALAIWSLVLGILAIFTAGLTGIPAVICGHLSLSRIKKSAGTQSGGGLAIAGLITGYFGFLIIGVALIAGLTAPLVIRQRKKADQTEAVSNARSFGVALYEFKTEYGRFPDETTAAAVADSTNTPKISGNSANDRFRQLIRAGIIQTEVPFYARAPGVHKPDGLIDGDNALAPGECGFAYVGTLITTDEVARPIAMTPMIPGTQQFEYNAFDGKAVILWTDHSVKSLPIEQKTGEVIFEGRNLLDPAHPVWGGKPPAIEMPE